MIREHRHVTRISKRNQVTIPAQILRDLGLRPGDEVEIEEKDGEVAVSKVIALRPASERRDEIVREREIPHLSDHELRVAIREAAEEAATARYLRGKPNA